MEQRLIITLIFTLPAILMVQQVLIGLGIRRVDDPIDQDKDEKWIEEYRNRKLINSSMGLMALIFLWVWALFNLR
jgi:hypothetical protein